MSKVVSMFSLRQRESEIKRWQGWVADQLYWHLMIDKGLPEHEVVNALGYPDCEHQFYAYQCWVEDNKHLFVSHKPIDVLNMALKTLSEKCNQYFEDYNWQRPDQYER